MRRRGGGRGRGEIERLCGQQDCLQVRVLMTWVLSLKCTWCKENPFPQVVLWSSYVCVHTHTLNVFLKMELEQKLVHIKMVSAKPYRERTAADCTCLRTLREHNVTSRAWYTLLISELKRLRQENRKLEAFLGYRASLKLAWAECWDLSREDRREPREGPAAQSTCCPCREPGSASSSHMVAPSLLKP